MNRIVARMFDVEFDELLVAAKHRCRNIETAEGLISGRRIEPVVALITHETWPDASKPYRLGVALNLFKGKPLTIGAGCRTGKIEDADAFEVVAEVDDEIERVSLLELEVHGIAIGAKTLLSQPPREKGDKQRKVR